MSSYTSAERKYQAHKITKTRDAAEEALRIAGVMARSAHAEGMPETEIARELGVNRMTVRRWLGKL